MFSEPSPNELGNSTILMELECGKVGGMCLPASECPEGSLSEPRGLCPKQQSSGIECCHGCKSKLIKYWEILKKEKPFDGICSN